MACFTSGTLINTSEGPVAVEDLRPGMLVVTRDNGFQAVTWVGIRAMSGRHLLDNPHLGPVFVKAGAFGNGLPTRDMMMSPNTRLPVTSMTGRFVVAEVEEMAALKTLVDHRGIQMIDTTGVSYVHVMLDGHQVIVANGCWVECFKTGDYSLGAIGNSQRNEIFELFPELVATQREQPKPAKRMLRIRRRFPRLS